MTYQLLSQSHCRYYSFKPIRDINLHFKYTEAYFKSNALKFYLFLGRAQYDSIKMSENFLYKFQQTINVYVFCVNTLKILINEQLTK